MNKFLTCFLVFSLCNCSQPAKKDSNIVDSNTRELIPDHDAHLNPKNKVAAQFDVIITEADKLRLRAEPSLNGEILETLPMNTVLQYLKEKTDHKDKITMKGLEHQAPWLKVRTSKGIEGWVYGSEGVDNYAAMIRFMKVPSASENPIAIVNGMTASKLEALTGLQGIHRKWNDYSGYYHYKLVNGVKELNGDMEFVARIYNDNYKFWLKNAYSGNYKNGFPLGKIVNNYGQIEGSTVTTIEFEGGTYKCKRITQKWESEGETGSEENNSPKSCSF